jgi:hypothetical protein
MSQEESKTFTNLEGGFEVIAKPATKKAIEIPGMDSSFSVISS